MQRLTNHRESEVIVRYNLDLQEMDGYIYTGKKARKSMDIFNRRASLAIERLIDLEGKSVIDIGCGDGTYSVELVTRMKAASVIGVEPSDAWKIASKKYSHLAPRVQFQCGKAYNLEFPNKCFDVSIMRGVLHHLDYPVKGLKEMLRVSKDVFLLEPNGYNPIVKLIEVLSPYHRVHGEKSYSPSTLYKWMKSLGGQFVGESFSSLVPLFCPDILASFLNWLSPKWEALPLIPKVSCGLYCVLFTQDEDTTY